MISGAGRPGRPRPAAGAPGTAVVLVGSTPELSVVAPAHNEADYLEDAIGEVVRGLRARGITFEVLICENGSVDATAAIAARLAAIHVEVRALHLDAADYGLALRVGFEQARGALVANLDVDLVDLAFVEQARALLVADPDLAIVIGTKRGAGSQDRRALSRRVVTHGFSTVMRYGFGLRATDTHGLKVLRRRTLAPLVGACASGSDIFDTELILRAERAGLRVAELPVTIDEIRAARTPISSRIPRTLGGLARLRVRLWRSDLRWLPSPPGAPPAPGVQALKPPAALPVTSPAMETEGEATPAGGALAHRFDNLTAALGEYRQAQERELVNVDEAMRDIELALARIERAHTQLATRVEAAIAATSDLERRLQDTIARQARLHADHLDALGEAHADAVAALGPREITDDGHGGAVDGEVLSRIEAEVGSLTGAVDALRRRIPVRARPERGLDDASVQALADALASRIDGSGPPAGPSSPPLR